MKRFAAGAAALAAAASAVLAVGCASARMEGATLVVHGRQPAGTSIGVWRVGSCRDASGGPLPDRDALVRLVKTTEGKVSLVEIRGRRDGWDSVVMDNVSVRSGDWVFEVAIASASGAPRLRVYTVPQAANADGRFALASRWHRRDTADGFIGTYTRAELTCALVLESRPAS